MEILTLENNEKELRANCSDVKEINQEISDICFEMLEVMTTNGGIGLAAPQVGVPLRMFVVAEHEAIGTKEPLVFINPEYKHIDYKFQIRKEGCLSLPGEEYTVLRKNKIRMKAMNLEGEEFEMEAEKLLSSVLQHEYDHLDGILIKDIHDSSLDKQKNKQKNKKKKKKKGKKK